MSKERTVEIHLGYYKQGDDLYHCIENSKNFVEAFRSHATVMNSVAVHLNKVADMIESHKVEIGADTHYIGLTCDEELAQKLIDAELAHKDPIEDELDEE